MHCSRVYEKTYAKCLVIVAMLYIIIKSAKTILSSTGSGETRHLADMWPSRVRHVAVMSIHHCTTASVATRTCPPVLTLTYLKTKSARGRHKKRGSRGEKETYEKMPTCHYPTPNDHCLECTLPSQQTCGTYKYDSIGWIHLFCVTET